MTSKKIREPGLGDHSAIFPTQIAVIGFLERREVLGVCRLIVVRQPLGSLGNHFKKNLGQMIP